jgi:uncharacterized protein YdiU (UPF0061 family)
MRQKLGFRSENLNSIYSIELELNDNNQTNDNTSKRENEILSNDEDFKNFVTELLSLLQWAHVDYTNFFRQLPSVLLGDDAPINDLFSNVRIELQKTHHP